MITDSIDSEFIRKTIPNIQFEVEGEQPFPEKLAPWINSAKNWLESEYLGQDDFLGESDNDSAVRIVILKAFADAVPSLDLVVTPTGFGVVSTESVAPASKERVERLLESLRSQIDSELKYLLRECRTYPEWRETERGRYFCSTFLSELSDTMAVGADSYDAMHSVALQSEALIARRFLGFKLMSELRDQYNSRDYYIGSDIHFAVRSVVLECVRAKFAGRFLAPYDIWHICQPIFQMLEGYPKFFDMWKEEMGNLFDHFQFKNDIKGSYYF